MISKQAALRLLRENLSDENRIRHSLMVSAIMGRLAERLEMNRASVETDWSAS